MGDWQPIETAPRDSTQFLAWGRAPGAKNHYFDLIRWTGNDHWPWSDGEQEYEYDTYSHWQPLPEPPTT